MCPAPPPADPIPAAEVDLGPVPVPDPLAVGGVGIVLGLVPVPGPPSFQLLAHPDAAHLPTGPSSGELFLMM